MGQMLIRIETATLTDLSAAASHAASVVNYSLASVSNKI